MRNESSRGRIANGDYLLENGICRSCREKIQPDAIALMEFKPLTPLFAAYEKELEQ